MCFWCRDPPFDNWQKKADRQKCSFLLFDHILPTPTAAADNPLNIYPDISSAVAAAPVANMAIIIITLDDRWKGSTAIEIETVTAL